VTPPDTPTLARLLTDAGTFRDAPFTLIDVGCSGGLIDMAGEFSPDLRAVGFDPLTTEVERLQSLESRAGVRFEAALVGAGDAHIGVPRETPNVFERSSAALYSRLHGFDHAREYFNAGAEIQVTDRRIRLDEWLAGHPDWRVDFLKVDTDGADLDVLLSLGERLAEPLAIYVEVSFDGQPGPSHNVFSTVFDLMTNAGFRLFALPVTKYARGVFPQPFEWEMPAQTTRGQIMAADALFCRDLAVEGDDDPSRILKLASIFDLMDLQDCAGELLEAHADAIRTATAVSDDAIARALADRTPLGLTPAESRKAFEADPSVFFPTRADNGDLIPAGQTEEPVRVAVTPDGSAVAIGTADGRSHECLDTGWSQSEEHGAWTAAPHASLALHLLAPIPAQSVLMLNGRTLTDVQIEATLAVAINDILLARDGDPVDGEVRFSVPHRIDAGSAELTIYAWPLVRPSDLTDSDDTRRLGFWLSAFSIIPGKGGG
jgi:FkbM family methyltransferase